ncbi:MAG: Fic family protein [Alphaproteobacteria bacterium]|nr:Fic family protein [Alphaproteobacteria bacterium]
MPLPCIPDNLNNLNLDWQKLAPFTSKAMHELGRYDGTLRGIVNPGVLLSPITNREAVLSSQIEGTQATLLEVLNHEAGQEYDELKRNEIHEIINYRHALLTGEEYLKERPITLQLIRQLHAMLMQDVRGGDKTPGKFREDQNWIGKKGSTIEQARFIPPNPVVMQEYLTKLQTFIDEDYFDPLVQLAIIHAQFEVIHPFNDGNGRLGRMLVPLFLFQKGVLQRPMFYLSEYFEETDQIYRDKLLAVTAAKDWQGWIEFFLRAIQIQAERNNNKAKSILGLYESKKSVFRDLTKSKFSQAALDALFKKPILNSTDFQKLTGIDSRPTATAILKALQQGGEIRLLRAGAGRSPGIFAFPALLEIADGK